MTMLNAVKIRTSSPKGNDRTPESNVPMSNVVFSEGSDKKTTVISQWGILLPWTPEFWSNLPQNLMQPFPHPNDATRKIWSRLANWLSSKVWNFRHSRASNSKMVRPKIELDRAFMPVLITSNFDDDSIKMNELAWRHHFPIISLWEMF